MYRDHRIAVVVPAYREAAILPRTLRGVPDFVDEVVVVDDGSDDETYALAREAAAADRRIEPVRLPENRGVGAAICAGYRRALELGADVAVVMAGDDQMDPADLPGLLDPIVVGRADYVKGNRLAHRDARKMPLARRVGTRVLARLTRLVAGIDVDDSQCGYTAISAEMVRRLPLDRVYPRYGYPNDMLMRLADVGARIVEVPVRPVYADEVSGLRPVDVVVPISGILLRGFARRLLRPRAPRPTEEPAAPT